MVSLGSQITDNEAILFVKRSPYHNISIWHLFEGARYVAATLSLLLCLGYFLSGFSMIRISHQIIIIMLRKMFKQYIYRLI